MFEDIKGVNRARRNNTIPKEKEKRTNNDIQTNRSSNTNQLKTGDELRFSGRVSSFCFTSNVIQVHENKMVTILK